MPRPFSASSYRIFQFGSSLSHSLAKSIGGGIPHYSVIQESVTYARVSKIRNLDESLGRTSFSTLSRPQHHCTLIVTTADSISVVFTFGAASPRSSLASFCENDR